MAICLLVRCHDPWLAGPDRGDFALLCLKSALRWALLLFALRSCEIWRNSDLLPDMQSAPASYASDSAKRLSSNLRDLLNVSC